MLRALRTPICTYYLSTIYSSYRDFPPSLGLSPLSQPSLGLSVVPLGFILLLDNSIMLAIVYESPPGCQPSFKNFPPRGNKSQTLQTMARAEPQHAWPAMLNNSPHGTEATVLTLRIARIGTS